MITHIIYHIPGRKVGCTKNLSKRRRWYPKGLYIEVLEELHDKTDQEAGDIEWAWADMFGYRREAHYALVLRNLSNLTPEKRLAFFASYGAQRSLSMVTAEQIEDKMRRMRQRMLDVVPIERRREIARIALAKAQAILELRPEIRREAGRKGGTNGGSKGGLKRAENMTPEQRSASARHASLIGSNIGGTRRAEVLTKEQLSDIGKKGQIASMKIGRCPYCGFEGNLSVWHLDNCRKKPN